MNPYILALFKLLLPSYARAYESRQKLLKDFPCLHCRPDGCTFYYNIACRCNVCGRKYTI